ncbi:MAG: Modification methylase MjaV [Candidatus Bathyarchaeota archaeon BA2]|nr:MAG: Modification methylase MjaV [Candidatus Bathyarchaeota archaeon BA2]
MRRRGVGEFARKSDEANLVGPQIIALNGKWVLYGSYYLEGYDVVIAHNDVLQFLKGFPESIATLVVTSPPYNIGKLYERRVELEKYLNWQKEVIRECVRITKPEGSICWEVGNYVENGEVYPLDVFFYDIFKDLGLKLRSRIIWRFGHGLHARMRFSGRYENILWFTMSDDYIFNLDEVRTPQKYPGKRAYKGPSKGKPTCHPKGKNPSDVWDILLRDWENEIWDIPNVKCNHPEKTLHPSQFPIELVERLVLALTNEGDVVFDPFVGVGSSLVAGLLHNRRVIGVDKEKLYTDIAYQRVIDALRGVLKRRPMERPIYKPSGREKVARPPPEWIHIRKVHEY